MLHTNTRDKYYITDAGQSLTLFKWTNDTVATCRCPYCGDSKKKKYKTRGYFFLNNKTNSYSFKCHNCGVAVSLYQFLEDHFPEIHKQMKFDFVQNKKIENEILKSMKVPAVAEKRPVVTQPYEPNPLEGYQTIFELQENHPAKIYMKNRKIPSQVLMRTYYAQDFFELSERLDPEKILDRSGVPRIIFPMYTADKKLFAVQGRTFTETDEVKYITLRKRGIDHMKIYGFDRFDPNKQGYCVEGPIDSEYLPNCIALAGAGKLKRNSLPFNPEKMTMIFDNEPRNDDICNYMAGCLHNGFRVCIWGKDYPFNDINDAILGGWTAEQIIEHIEKNSEKGLIGINKLGSWRV